MITASIVLLIALYAAGTRAAWKQAGRGRAIRTSQVWYFVAAMVILVVALLALDEMADDLFSAHMAQHVLLAVVLPPLLVASAPVTAMMWVLPMSARRALTKWAHDSRWTMSAWHALTAPSLAWAIHGVTLWVWHLPRLYGVALEQPAIHALEHVSFIATGSLMWWSMLHPRRSRRAGYAVGILILFATMMHTGALGAMITLSHRVWFPAQEVATARWGLTPLEDQQLAGLIMWVPGGLLYLVEMSVLFLAWMDRSARRRTMAATAAIGALAAAGCSRAEGASIGVGGGNIARGKQVVASAGCGGCHEISDVRGARGLVGPPLDGIANRSIIAGELGNTPMNMERWISDPQGVEPDTDMPNLHLTESQVRDVVAYLYTLRQ